MEILKNAGGLVYSQAAFFFGTCAGRRYNFFFQSVRLPL
jgi:hypothetical protein